MKPAAWIACLIRDGSIGYSHISRESLPLVEQLQALGLVALEIQGNRRRVLVRDQAAFQNWFDITYPMLQPAPTPGRRAANIARTRQSKRGTATHDAQPLLLRWFSSDPSSPWAVLTQRCGMVGITSDRMDVLDIPESWVLLTVENWESFLALDYLPQTTIVAIFTSGNIAESTLRQLALLQPPPTEAIHFGDYDWSGLAIFRRIQSFLPQLRLYVPSDIEELFSTFASYAILNGQLPLAVRPDDPAEVRRIIELIATFNAGLEQEVVVPPRI
jgi:hypothetical protein